MAVGKHIIALLLAVLLVYPSCCCAFSNHDSSTLADEATAHSCCPETEADPETKDESIPAQEHDCECVANNLFTELDSFTLLSPHLTCLPFPAATSFDVTGFTTPVRIVRAPRDLLTAGPPLCILFSVFRI